MKGGYDWDKLLRSDLFTKYRGGWWIQRDDI